MATRVECEPSGVPPPPNCGTTGVWIFTVPTFAGAEQAGGCSVPILASAAVQTAWPSIAAWSSRNAPPRSIVIDLALEAVGNGPVSCGSWRSTSRKLRVRELALAPTETEGRNPTKSHPVGAGRAVDAPVRCSGSW